MKINLLQNEADEVAMALARYVKDLENDIADMSMDRRYSDLLPETKVRAEILKSALLKIKGQSGSPIK